jgi:hypothetical protein
MQRLERNMYSKSIRQDSEKVSSFTQIFQPSPGRFVKGRFQARPQVDFGAGKVGLRTNLNP